MKNLKVYFGSFALFLLLDQVVKELCRMKLVPNQSMNGPWPGIFEIKLTYNEGIAFGMFQGQGLLFAPVALIITAYAMSFSMKHPKEPGWTHFAMGLLSAGAIGNLIDRVWAHKVTDMFWIRAINFPIFNVADVAITFGAILLGLRVLFEKKPAPAPVVVEEASVPLSEPTLDAPEP